MVFFRGDIKFCRLSLLYAQQIKNPWVVFLWVKNLANTGETENGFEEISLHTTRRARRAKQENKTRGSFAGRLDQNFRAGTHFATRY